MAVDGDPVSQPRPTPPAWVYLGSDQGDVIAVPFATVHPDAAPNDELLTPRSRPGESPRSQKSGGTVAKRLAGRARMARKGLGAMAAAQDKLAQLVRDAHDASPFRHVSGVRVFCGHVFRVLGLLLFQHRGTPLLASTGEDKTIRISDSRTQAPYQVIAEMRSVPGRCLGYHAQFQRLVVGGQDGVLGLWDPALGERTAVLHRFPEPVSCVAVGPSAPVVAAPVLPDANISSAGPARVSPRAQQTILVGTRNGHIYVYDAAANGGQMRCAVALIAPGRKRLCDDRGGGVATVVPPAALAGGPVHVDPTQSADIGHAAAVTALEAPNGGPYIFSGDDRGVICVWHCGSTLAHSADGAAAAAPVVSTPPRQVCRLRLHVDRISSLRLAGDGTLFAASGDCTLSVWHWADGLLVQHVNGHYHNVTGSALAVANTREPTAAAAQAAAAPSAWPGHVALAGVPAPFTPCLLTASRDGEVVVWDLAVDPAAVPRRPPAPIEVGTGLPALGNAGRGGSGAAPGWVPDTQSESRFASLCQTDTTRFV